MVERKISYKRYILAAIITALLFSLGFLVGLIIEGERITYFNKANAEQRVESQSLQLQYLYLSLLTKKQDCNVVSGILYNSLINLEATREKLEGFKEVSEFSKDELDLLMREYLISQMRFWLLVKETQEYCDTDVVTILHFYQDYTTCGVCENQAIVLNSIKDILEQKVYIFSFNTKYINEPMVGVLLQSFNITTYPSLVVNNNVLEGFTDRDKLFNVVCDSYIYKPLECL